MSTCSFLGCGREACAKGLCASHYLQQLRGRPLTEIRERSGPGEGMRRYSLRLRESTWRALGKRPGIKLRELAEKHANGRGTK